MGYRYDIQHLSPQAQAIIRDRDKKDELLKKQNNSKNTSSTSTSVYPISIFMRLGMNPSIDIDGIATMNRYKEFCNKFNSVWFSTDSLANGIAKKQQKIFINAIQQGHTVYIYFVIGKAGNGKMRLNSGQKLLIFNPIKLVKNRLIHL